VLSQSQFKLGHQMKVIDQQHGLKVLQYL